MLRQIPADGLRDVWVWVRNGLLHCAGRCGERWMPEDVFVSLKSGHAHLFAIEWHGDEVGFCVLQQHVDVDGPALFVWALWTEPGSGVAAQDAIERALEGKAREIGAKRIRMQSPRKGWGRQEFWRPVSVTYEHEVT